jgi:multiple sugar transport system permease protein
MSQNGITGIGGLVPRKAIPTDAIEYRWWRGVKAQELFGKIAVMLVLALGVFVIMIPAVWMVSVSLQTDAEVYSYPPKWIPTTFAWENYVAVFTLIPFMRLLNNTLIITAGRLIGNVASASLVAFAFARLRAPLRNALFLLVLATMMLPGQVTMVPQFVLFSKMGWVNTFKPLIVPAFFGGGAFNVFLLRQFFMTIPTDYDDAARIDGCGYFQLYWRIILPLSAPALATIAIFTLMWSWNDFMGPLIYLRSMTNSTLALGLYFFRGVYNPEWNRLMAMSLLVMLPIVLLFFFAQRYFIQGVVISGIKG